MLSSLKPARILTVTGFWTAFAMASTIFPTSTGFFISAEPSPLLTTFGTGHPIFTSIMSNGRSSTRFAISPITSGSEPNSCNAIGCSFGVTCINASVFLLPYKIAFALTISVYKRPQSISLHNRRNGRSVTPAIGASTTGFCISTFPINIHTLLFVILQGKTPGKTFPSTLTNPAFHTVIS